MKKVCIITVYNSENCGSYWQAFALQESFLRLGYDVFFLRREMKGTSHSAYSLIKRCLRSLKRLDFVGSINAIKQFCAFERYATKFATVDACSPDFDLCVLGSDTIWNLESAYFRKNRRVFWGGESEAKKTISYAASVANSSDSLIAHFPELQKYIQNLNKISVRDTYTEQIVGKIAQQDLRIVCDPTLLFDKNFYQSFVPCNQKEKKNKYMFVYYFGKMPEALEAKVRLFAQEKKLEIITMGGSLHSGVRNLYFDPYVFLECFKNSDFVITNTFHGTIFTLLFEKPAVFNSDGKNKVRELLQLFQLETFDCYDKMNSLHDYFCENKIDYENVRKKIDSLRGESKHFLEIV